MRELQRSLAVRQGNRLGLEATTSIHNFAPQLGTLAWKLSPPRFDREFINVAARLLPRHPWDTGVKNSGPPGRRETEGGKDWAWLIAGRRQGRARKTTISRL